MCSKNIQKIFNILWLGLPIALWFSYHPVIRLGQDSTTYFELSIPLIYLVVLAVMSLPSIIAQRKKLLVHRFFLMTTLLVLFTCLTLMWTENLTRGVLECGVMGILLLILAGAIANRHEFSRLLPRIIKIYIITAMLMSVFAMIQIFLGIWLPPETTLLCDGCVAQQFGFVRPNVFMIEPQFFGNALLPSLITLAYILLARAKKMPARFVSAAFFIQATALVLTLSRGALAAYTVGILFIIGMLFIQRRPVKLARFIGIHIVSFCAALCIQGVAAYLHPTIQQDFYSTISKSVNQLSLGVVSLPKREQPPLLESKSSQEKVAPHFDGYVEESTSARVSRSQVALQAWSASPQTMIAGVGIGSAGIAMYVASPALGSPREIVQNQYIEVLLERGIIGALLFLATLIMLWRAAKTRPWTRGIILAFLVQWMFFSGLPNALHIYITIIVLLIFAKNDKHRLEQNPDIKPHAPVLDVV